MKDRILLVDACVRAGSRTRRLAQTVLDCLAGDVQIIPAAAQSPITGEDFLALRNAASAGGDFSHPAFDTARAFAAADEIVIAAPYWDLSFPAVLKAFMEQICVVGLTFCYTADNQPRSLCRARRLIYVTTAGGDILSDSFGFGYVKALAQTFFGIPEVVQFKAERLDLPGTDVEAVLQTAQADIRARLPG